MNNAQVATNGDTYPYRAYLITLLIYGCDAKESWLKCLEGWQTDKDGKYNAQENVSLNSRGKIITNNLLFDFKGRLHSDMLLQERLMPNNVNVWLVLSPSWPAFHFMDFGGQAGISCTHRGGHPGGMQGQGCALWTAAPGKGPDRFGDHIPASPYGHRAFHPSPGGQHSWYGCFVHRTNTYQGHHGPVSNEAFSQRLAEESLQLRTYGPEFGLPGCGWTTTTGPALAARLWVRLVCRDLPCPTEVQ